MNTTDERMQRLLQAEAHGHEGETVNVIVEALGYQTDVTTDRYRLVISTEGYLYLTDRHTSAGCTCHGKGARSIDELIALLTRARQIMSEGGV